jgi:dTDP-4-dehydrorhamnose reductase
VKVLVFGKDGQVGRALSRALPGALALGRAEADFERPETLAAAIVQHAPDVVVNAAAYTNVDEAEDDRTRAWAINADAVGVMGETARTVGAMVVHYSTDYVFDGRATGAQDETAPTGPLNVYGASKLAGEEALRRSGADHVILRTSWVYGPTGRNFALTILRLALERTTLDVVADQYGAPTSADLIAAVTARIIATPRPGLFHLAASGRTSWHGFAVALVEAALSGGARLALDPKAITPIPASAWAARPARPANSSLDTSKIREAYDLELPAWQDGIGQLIRVLRSEGRL